MLGMTNGKKAIGGLSLLVGLCALAPAAQAEGRFGPNDVRTIFVIGKNTDKNEVQFGIRLDKECVPVGDEPIYNYWRQYEKGPEVTEDLNFLDKTGYGIKDQKVETRATAGSKVTLRLKATDRAIAVYSRKEGDKCVAEAMTFINSTAAKLQRIHVELSGPISIKYIEIRGVRADNKQPIVERTKP